MRSSSTSGIRHARPVGTRCRLSGGLGEYQGRNVRFIGLFVPQGFDTEVEARQFVDEFGLTFDFATDVRARVAQEYAVQFFPTTYFIDRAGRIHKIEISRMDVDRLTDILEELAG